jgi:hypothetical protein
LSKFDAGIGGLGAALIIALAVCYGKSRDLSYSMFERWRARKETSKTQLEDLTVRTMFALQADLNRALGEHAGGDELIFTVDPTQFRPRVLAAAHYYELRQKIDQFYSRGRILAGFVPRCLEASILAASWFFVRVSWERTWSGWTLPLAIWLISIAGGSLVLSYLAHLYFEGKLKGAIVEAEEGSA